MNFDNPFKNIKSESPSTKSTFLEKKAGVLFS